MIRPLHPNRLTLLRGIASLVLILILTACGAAPAPGPKTEAVTEPLMTLAAQETPPAAPALPSPTALSVQTEPPPAATTEPAETLDPLAIPVTGLCGSGSLNLLVLGLNVVETGDARGTDAVRLVHADFEAKTIETLALPAFLWVETAGLETAGIPAAQINRVYPEGLAQAKAGGARQARALAEGGALAVAQTVHTRFAFSPDYYAVVDPTGFSRMVERLGGLAVEVPAAIPVTGIDTSPISAGPQRLDGKQALDYARTLLETGDAERIERQNRLLRAIFEETARPANWLKIPGMLGELSSAVHTNLSIEQMARLACLGRQAGGSGPLFEIPAEALSTDAEGRLVADEAVVREMVRELGIRD
jgi:LCP family protein required for cell wall assembly